MELLFNDTFSEIAVILTLAMVLGIVGLKFKQPLIVAFIAVGILVGPSALNWVEPNDQIDLLAKLGIALLLFLVGLKLDLHIIRTMGAVALAAGLGQVLFTSLFGFLIALALGMELVSALYVAVALTFSSTIIIVKLLSDKRELDDLHGRIAIGFLIVQDIVVVIVMIVLTALGEAEGSVGLGQQALKVLLNGIGLLLFIFVCMRFLLTPLLQALAKSSEILVLFSITWAVSLAAIGVELGFSKEVGAFLAGVSIASTPFREVIAARLVSLRDFLLLFFFIDLGVGLDISTLGAQVGPALLFSAFVLIGNPLIVMSILGFMGYRKRTGFLAGLTVAQISEFSLILATLGFSQGHINTETMGLITLVGLITISMSTYMIIYSKPLFSLLEPYLSIFERKATTQKELSSSSQKESHFNVILFGLGRTGIHMAEEFERQGQRVLVIDNDQQRLREHAKAKYAVGYGDMESPEFVSHISLVGVRWVVSSLSHLPDNLSMLHALTDAGYAGNTAVVADNFDDRKILQSRGVTQVIMPHSNAAIKSVEDLLLIND